MKKGFGGGLLVVCWLPDYDLFVQYLHLSGLGPDIPYYDPEVDDPNEPLPSFIPTIILQPSYDFVKYAKYVEGGELIGFVGTSGLSADGIDEPTMFPPMKDSWDGPHVHIMIHGDRIWDPALMLWKRDPKQIYDMFDIYSNFEEYTFVFEFCSGMMACDPKYDPFPLYPLQCDGFPANGAVYKEAVIRLNRPSLASVKLKKQPRGRDYTLHSMASAI